MPYYLAIERNPDSYEAINIKNTEKGKEIFRNDKGYECTLDEIDRFTTEYMNLAALGNMLYWNKKVPWSNCSLALVNFNGIEIKITQDFLFSPSKKYLENPDLLVKYITNKFLNFDIEFTTELIQCLSDNKTKTMVQDLVNTMNECIVYNMPLEVNNLMNIAQVLVYNHDENGLVSSPMTINYENLHKVVFYIANYENKKMKENAKTKIKTKNT